MALPSADLATWLSCPCVLDRKQGPSPDASLTFIAAGMLTFMTSPAAPVSTSDSDLGVMYSVSPVGLPAEGGRQCRGHLSIRCRNVLTALRCEHADHSHPPHTLGILGSLRCEHADHRHPFETTTSEGCAKGVERLLRGGCLALFHEQANSAAHSAHEERIVTGPPGILHGVHARPPFPCGVHGVHARPYSPWDTHLTSGLNPLPSTFECFR